MSDGVLNRASMDHAGKAVSDGGTKRSTWRNTEAEKARAIDDAAYQVFAARNPLIRPERRSWNIDRVNDGHGGFRQMESFDESADYMQSRLDRMRKQPTGSNRHMLTSVYHLPKSMCDEETRTVSMPVTDASGEPVLDDAGDPVVKGREVTYWTAKDPDEMQRYFDAVLDYQADLMPGGQESIASYSINLDESRPHIQILGDTAMDAGKGDGRLVGGYSRAFGRHRSDPEIAKVDRKGNPVLDDAGEQKWGKPTASEKMAMHHAAFREHMRSRGFEIEMENSARSAEHYDLPTYKAVMTAAETQEIDEVLLDARCAQLDADEAALDEESQVWRTRAHRVRTREEKLDADTADLDARTTALDARETALTDRERTVTTGEADLRRRQAAMTEEEERQERRLSERWDTAVEIQDARLAEMMPEMVDGLGREFARQARDEAPGAYVTVAKDVKLRDGKSLDDHITVRLGRAWEAETKTWAQQADENHQLIESIRAEMGNQGDRDRAAGREVDGGREL